MTIEDAKRKLYDTTFLLGRFRRRDAIRALAGLSDSAGVLPLAEALAKKHPNSDEILDVFRHLSPKQDADKVVALWGAWGKTLQPVLADVLVQLGWPPERPADTNLALDILNAAEVGASPEILQAVAVLVRALPVADETLNDAVYAAWINSQSEALEQVITKQRRQPSRSAVLWLANALRKKNTHSAAMMGVLKQLSPARDADKVMALWGALGKTPQPVLAGVLVQLGWPPGRPVDARLARDILNAVVAGASPEILQAVAVLVRALPVADETLNDAIYAAWIKSQSEALERVITKQRRQPSQSAVLLLAEALGKKHPHSAAMMGVLKQLSPAQDADKVMALWGALGKTPQPVLAMVLAQLGWPPGRPVEARLALDIINAAVAEASPEILQAVAVLVRALPLADETLNDAVYSAWVKSQSRELEQVITEQRRQPSRSAVLLLAKALDEKHPHSTAMMGVLKQLSPAQDADKVMALWGALGKTFQPVLAGVLAQLGWPPGRPVDARLARDVLNAAVAGASPEILRVVAILVRALPVADETLNDAVYAAWIKSQSDALERVITEQERQPGNPGLETLHALVTGRVGRYTALKDEDGLFLAQAWAIAPPSLRTRLTLAVSKSQDRLLRNAYGWVLSGGGLDDNAQIAALKLVGAEDSLFEKTRSLRLGAVLDLCERWATNHSRPTRSEQRSVVDRAVAAYRALGTLQVVPSSELPTGLVDMFEYWRRQQPSEGELREDLQAEDPLRKARGLYLGHQRGLVDHQRLAEVAQSKHWLERLIPRLINITSLAKTELDHVLWVSACASDGAMLQTPIGGDPGDYQRHSNLLQQASRTAATRTRSLLEILCAFQGAFVASDATMTTNAAHSGDVMIENVDAKGEF